MLDLLLNVFNILASAYYAWFILLVLVATAFKQGKGMKEKKVSFSVDLLYMLKEKKEKDVKGYRYYADTYINGLALGVIYMYVVNGYISEDLQKNMYLQLLYILTLSILTVKTHLIRKTLYTQVHGKEVV